MSQSIQEFDFQDLDDIVLGAHFFAAGGGGALKNGLDLVDQAKKVLRQNSHRSQGVQYIAVSDVPDNNWMPVLSAMGAPAKFLEFGYGHSPVSAFLAHERLLQYKLGNPSVNFSAMIPDETGSISHGMSILVAATLGLPIVDGDGAGRAVPCLQMLTFANPNTNANIRLSPAALTSETPVSEGGATFDIDCNSSSTVDALTRSIISADVGFEDRASLSCYAMQGRQVKEKNALVHNTLTMARNLGRALRTTDDAIETVKELPNSQMICKGNITKLNSSTRDGFDWLDIFITADDGEELVITAKNENMLLWSKTHDTPLVLAPDLICYLQFDEEGKGTAASNSEIQQHFASTSDPMPIAVFSLRAQEPIRGKWFHEQYGEVFESYGYYGSYHEPETRYLRTETNTVLKEATA